jgi:hypothetical protein
LSSTAKISRRERNRKRPAALLTVTASRVAQIPFTMNPDCPDNNSMSRAAQIAALRAHLDELEVKVRNVRENLQQIVALPIFRKEHLISALAEEGKMSDPR